MRSSRKAKSAVTNGSSRALIGAAAVPEGTGRVEGTGPVIACGVGVDGGSTS